MWTLGHVVRAGKCGTPMWVRRGARISKKKKKKKKERTNEFRKKRHSACFQAEQLKGREIRLAACCSSN